MSAPTVPTAAHHEHVCQDFVGSSGPSSVVAHTKCVDHALRGNDGPNSCDAHGRTASHGPTGVAGSAPTEPPSHLAAAEAFAATRSAPTPPGAPMNDASANTGLARPEGFAPSATPELCTAANVTAASLADPFLALAADVLDDLEKVRIANENRLRQLTRSAADSDGEERGFGLDQSHPDVARLAALVDSLAKAEHSATLNLNRLMRAHPLGPWAAEMPGVGTKQSARLLACIGDPAWNDLTDDWRTLRQLWSYAGYGDAGKQVRRRGHKGNWDATAKMRAHLIAVSCVKVGRGPLREVYDQGRARYSGAVHDAPCVRCGPSGKPAQPGSPISAGHQHARALRLVAKELLRGLWREARRLHGFELDDDSRGNPTDVTSAQGPHDGQPPPGAGDSSLLEGAGL